jgi:GWxTD domain-containing protein
MRRPPPSLAAHRVLWFGVVVCLLVGWGGAAAAQESAPSHPSHQDLGPIGWLLLPSEEKEFRQAVTAEERARLEERFWRRRNPSDVCGVGGEPVNANQELFAERVTTADLLYGEEDTGTPGSLTQRGRAHILLGPPSYLSQRYQTNPHWDPGLWQRRGASRRPLLVETWGYRPEDLTPELRRELAERGWPFELQLRFIVREGRTFVLEGEPFLDAAARSFLRRGPGAR